MASFFNLMFFEQKIINIEIKWVWTGKAVGVIPVELLACQVSMVCAANLYTLNVNIGLSEHRHQFSHLHILHIFHTQLSLELMQIFENG